MASGLRPFHPAFAELQTAIAVFPLPGALLLPGGRLPLNIFEPRYLAMVETAMAEGRLFGMIQPDARRPEGPQGPGLFSVGCLGRITSFAETEDGRLVISLLGLIRFRVVEELEMQRGFRRLQVDYAPFQEDLQPPTEPWALDREPLLSALRGYFDRQGLSADWDAIAALDDEALVTALCMICPFSPSEKQALLEAETVPRRGVILLQLLTFGLHGPEAEGDGAPRLS
ncbi:LON peptidase substrate-binding domain-containing protein [Acidisoma sp. 7E03]